MHCALRQFRVAHGGFSLLEALVALGIAAILSLTAWPGLARLHEQYALRATADELGLAITRARMQAIAQNAFVRIRFVDPHHYVRERSDDGRYFQQDGGIQELPSGIAAEVGTGGPPTFTPSGLARRATDIRLRSAHGTRLLAVNTLGRVTVS